MNSLFRCLRRLDSTPMVEFFLFPIVIRWDDVYNCGWKWRKMFIGQKEQTIDEKNRLALPSLYRKDFPGDVLYVTLGLDSCLEVYPESVYEEKAKQYSLLNDFDPAQRRVKRAFLSNTFQLTIDSHSRILVPRPLLDRLKIGRKVILVGLNDHIEIWDSEVYGKVADDEWQNFASYAQEVYGAKS